MYRTKKFILFLFGGCFLSILTTSFALAKSNMLNYSQGFFPFFAGSFCIIPLIMTVVWIILAVWVYRDAEQRGENAVLWLLIVLVTGIVGLIIWLVIRPQPGGQGGSVLDGLGLSGGSSQPDRMCPSCGRPIPMDAQVCPYCGKRFGQ